MEVKIITEFSSDDLERKIAEFSSNNDIIDIKYSISDYILSEMRGVNHYTKHSALIMYKRRN